MSAAGETVRRQTPFEAQGEFMTLRQLQGQMADADLVRRQSQGANEAYSAAYHDGQIDEGMLGAELAQRGLGSQIPAAQAAALAGRTARTKSADAELDFKIKQLGRVEAEMASQLRDPNGLSDQNIIRVLQRRVDAEEITQEQAVEAMRDIPPEGPARRAWAMARYGSTKEAMEVYKDMRESAPTSTQENLGDHLQEMIRDPMTGKVTRGASQRIGVSPTSVFSEGRADARQRLSLADAREARSTAPVQFIPGLVTETGAPVAFDPRGNRLIQAGVGQQPAGGPALATKPRPAAPANIPASLRAKMAENASTIHTLQRAIALSQGQTVPGARGQPAIVGDAAATGWKGMLPDEMLQRWDKEGVATRGQIADIGSLVLHDRSGANITAAETPRLKPFIPAVSDESEVVTGKLQRMLAEAETSSMYLELLAGGPVGVKPAAAPADATEQTFTEGDSVVYPDGKILVLRGGKWVKDGR